MGGKNWNQTELIISPMIIVFGWQQEQQTSPNFLCILLWDSPLCLSLSVCVSSPSPSPLPHVSRWVCPCTVTMAIPGLWRHSAVVQCLCPFLILLCLSLCFVWLIMSGLSNVSISKVVWFDIFYIFNVSFLFLVVFGLFIYLQLISFRACPFHSLRNIV